MPKPGRRATTRMAMGGMLAALLTGAPAPLAARADLPRWMAGCWSGSRGGEQFTERWLVADAATMIGTSHTVKDGTLNAFEFLRVVLKGGTAVYIAQPNGVAPTEFAATGQSTSTIVFVNPSHDFPKRVGYRLVDATHLTAWIDGGETAKGQRLEFAMTRASCD
jgi:hypothetical protein